MPWQKPGAGDPPPPANLPRIPGITLHFELARGGMGVVYSGRQDFLDRRVAVKFLSVDLGGEKFAQRFQREAKILAGIKHANIVACHSAGTTDDGQSYLVMEFIDGPNLKSWIGDNGPVASPAALRLARSVAQALAHALSLDVIHRDVKCENILLETMTSTAIDVVFPFVPKLVDLGLARMTSESAGLGLTSPGSVMGTPATMSPEQFDEPDSVDFRTDIYGLGCVLYEMLVGKPAYRGTKLTDIVTKKRQPIGPNPCDDNRDVPAEVGAFVSRMLSANRDARPGSYKELDDRLQALATSLPVWGGSSAAIDPQVTGATIVSGKPMGMKPTAKPVPSASAPPSSPPAKKGPGMLGTAEFEFLAAGGENAESMPAAFSDGSSAVASGASAVSTVGGGAASQGRPVPKRGATAAIVTVLMLAAAWGGWFAFGWSGNSGNSDKTDKTDKSGPVVESPNRDPQTTQATQTTQPSDVAVPKPRPAETPAPTNAPPRVVSIEGGAKVPLERNFKLSATVEDTDGGELKYGWSSAPGNPISFIRSDRNPAEVRVYDGLPGETFAVDLEVSDGHNPPVRATTQVEVAEKDFPSQKLLIGFKTNPKWNLDEPEGLVWNEIPDRPPYVACRTLGESRTMSYSLGDESFWQVLGELESKKDDSSLVFAEVGVRLELGDRGWIIQCTRGGSDGDTWSAELLQARLKDGAWQASPLRPAKRVEWSVGQEDRFGLVSIKRQRAKVSISFGQRQLELYASHEDSLEGLDVVPRLTLFAKGGRGSFRGFTLL
ncbi:MAG: protein kinase [Planctomycetota bacterium]